MEYILTGIIILLGVRTAAWHLQNWQLREYRFDRMRARRRTKEGHHDLWSLWFFRGFFPRPKLSGRILLICFIFIGFTALDLFLFTEPIKGLYYWIFKLIPNAWALPVTFLIWERFIWLYLIISVWISKLPVWLAQTVLFNQAQAISKKSADFLTRIAITGSYGKSSTKEILAHVLQSHFGAENVLYNPANKNHEIALARLIKTNREFFGTTTTKPKFCILEAGAYRRGDLKKVAKFFQPQHSIITNIGQQHLDLFGSQRNIQLGKFELAEGATDKVFFNADNALSQEIFNDKDITATPIGLSKKSAEKIVPALDHTTFEMYGEKFHLPWPGEFFVNNALLALECARELGVPKEKLPHYLKTLPPLERALQIETNSRKNFTILKDLYSANPNGVLSAVEHLGKVPGKKIFIGIPLLELGPKSAEIHEQIFYALKKAKAEVYWLKADHANIAQHILGERFHLIDPANPIAIKALKKSAEKLTKADGVLFESRVPKEIIKLFE